MKVFRVSSNRVLLYYEIVYSFKYCILLYYFYYFLSLLSNYLLHKYDGIVAKEHWSHQYCDDYDFNVHSNEFWKIKWQNYTSFSSYALSRILFHYYVLNYFRPLSELVLVLFYSCTTRSWYTMRDIIWFYNVYSLDSYSLTFDEISVPQSFCLLL